MNSSLQTASVEQSVDPAGQLLANLLELFDREQVPYSLLHGYEEYPQVVAGDVDCILPAAIVPKRLASLLQDAQRHLGMEIVQWLADNAHFIVLRSLSSENERGFLQLHVATDYELRKRVMYSAEEVLASRQQHNQLWAPAPHIAFACCLARRVSKGRIRPRDAQQLESWHRQAPGDCEREAARFWSTASVQSLMEAVETGNWERLEPSLPRLRDEALRSMSRRHPLRLAKKVSSAALGWVRRWLTRDRGLSVMVLGVDGSGKSSAAKAAADRLAPAFNGSVRQTFPPALLKRGPRGTNSTPHKAAPRSPLASTIRALGYWLPFATLGYLLTTGRLLRKNKLVIHDRHLLDALVDPRRYRYAGPAWLLRLIWRVIPKPDLVILLDVPAEVAQARKQEVPFDETARQCEAYRTLLKNIPNGHIVDGTQGPDEVASQVSGLMLEHLRARTARGMSRRFSL